MESTASPSISMPPKETSGGRKATLIRWLKSFGLVIFFVPFMSKVEEWYPFSHFPMYSNLAEIWTLQLTNEKDEPLSPQNDFTGRPNSIRKLTTARMRQVQAEWGISTVTAAESNPQAYAEAAKRTLTWLVETHPPKGRAAEATALKLWKISHSVEEGAAVKKRVLIYEHPMVPSAPTPSGAIPAPASNPSTPSPTP
jgi:hypothetical protein